LTENLHRSRFARDNARDAREVADQVAVLRPLLLEPAPETLSHYLAVVSVMPPARAQEAASHMTRADIFVARKMFEDAVIEYKRASGHRSLRFRRREPAWHCVSQSPQVSRIRTAVSRGPETSAESHGCAEQSWRDRLPSRRI
jgi:hypothetical protein